MISWITDQVAIGEWSDSHNMATLIQQCFDCVINLCIRGDEYELGMQDIAFLHLKVADHQDKNALKIELEAAVYMLILAAREYDRILVHCIAGMDRSPFVVARYMVAEGLAEDMADAYAQIKEKRPQTMEHMEWV